MTTEYQQLLKQYNELDKKIEGLDEERRHLQEKVNAAFALEVKENQLLSPLPWVLSAGCTSLDASCNPKKHPESHAFLDNVLGETGWHFSVKLLDGVIFFNDNVLTIYFDSVEQCIEFCRTYGISPSLKEVQRERKNAQDRLNNTLQALEAFGELQRSAKCVLGHDIPYENAFCSACAAESAPG